MTGLFALISNDAVPSEELHEQTEKGLCFFSQCQNSQNTVFLSDKKSFLDQDSNSLSCLALGISTSNQKQWASVGNSRILFQGQLFNRKDIIQETRLFYPDYGYDNDATLILSLFLQKGTAAFADLEGSWSLIIADLDKRKMYAARDAFGNSPLYCCKTKTHFGIASKMRSLFSVVDDAKEINNQAVIEYLLWGNVAKQNFFSNIHEIKPSHYIEYSLEDNSYTELPYYTLTYKDCKGGYNEYEEPYYIDTVRKLVIDSVAANIADKNTIAIGLNGGITDLSVLCCAKKINPELQITAFTSADLYDDATAEKIINYAGAEWKKVNYSPQRMLKNLEEIYKIQDIPVSDLSCFVQYEIMKNANQQGFDSVLGGQGGNELFGGYRDYFSPFLRSLRSQWMLKHWALELFHLKNTNITSKEIRLMRQKNRAYTNKKKSALKTKSKELELLNKDYVNAYFSNLHSSVSSKNVLNDYLFEDYTTFLPQILRWEGQMAAGFQLNCLLPFSNSKKLTEYVFSIPSTFKIHHGWSNYLLRKAMTGIVPDEILWKKQEFGSDIPQKHFFQKINKEIKEQIKQGNDMEQFVDKDALLKQWDTLYTSENYQFQLFIFRYIHYLAWKNELNDW